LKGAAFLRAPSDAPAGSTILLAFVHHADEHFKMPACTQNVKKRKARRMKNDRLHAAKNAKAAKAKG
jgi:hypothetical protein